MARPVGSRLTVMFCMISQRSILQTSPILEGKVATATRLIYLLQIIKAIWGSKHIYIEVSTAKTGKAPC